MMRRSARTAVLLAAALATALPASAQKAGGVLNAITFDIPASFSILEEPSSATTFAMLPCYNNLIFYNPARAEESGEDVSGELAEHWAWSDGGKRLTFRLRKGVTWHDGKAFTAADVKYTYNLVRGVGERKLRLNPRKQWLENVADISTQGDWEVTFVLKRPQPSLVSMLASGFMPVYPAHVEPAELRTHVVGTGPFRLKEYVRERQIVLERNPAYFVRGRPYLDGVVYHILGSRAARQAALQADQVDVYSPIEGTSTFRDTMKAAVPNIVVQEVAQSIADNILINPHKPPFDNPKVRVALSYALDRHAMIQSVLRGAGVPSGTLLPPPWGQWGLPADQLRKLPGYGDPDQDKGQARRLLEEAGYGAGHPLKVTVSTRAVELSEEAAVWTVSELRKVGVEATLEPVESAAWFARMARRDYQVAFNQTGTGAEDPDANLFENYTCGSNRNYSDYCNPEVDAMIARQSQELDRVKRRALVREIDTRLQLEAARPILAQRINYFMHWPYVKNLVAKNSIFNFSRMQDVWLDK